MPVRLSPEATVWFAPPKVDSGVPSRERADGAPILDDIWADESFIGDREFLAVVRRTTRRFEQLGLLTRAERPGLCATPGARTSERATTRR